MEYEIRPVTADEADAFVRAIPGGAGLPTHEPEPAAWWAGPGYSSPFDTAATDAEVAAFRSQVLELDRSQAAFASGKLAGTAAVFSLELTIPGRGPVPMGGVTAVGVIATQRRRGLLRGMMRAMIDDCHARGELLAGLGASEGGIYGRYGFGPATFQVRWELARSSGGLAALAEDHGRLELADGATVLAVAPDLHDRIRQTRTGMLSAYPRQWAERTDVGDGARRFVLHYAADGETVDGAACYRLPYSPDPAASGIVQVEWLHAASAAAYTALWALLADMDLTKRVIAAKRPPDEPLRWQLTNPRAMRVTRASDDLWVRLVDVPGALGARSYAVDGTLTIEVTDEFCQWNTGRWRLDGGPDGAACVAAPAGSGADLATDAATLGSLYLGGLAPGPLARAGRLRELRPGALDRLTTMLAQADAPWTLFGF